MLQLKKTAVAVILGLGCTAFAQANFVGYLGELSPGTTLAGGNDFNGTDVADWYTFDVSDLVLNADSTVTISTTCNGGGCFNVNGLEFFLYQGKFTGNNQNGLNNLTDVTPTQVNQYVNGLTLYGTFAFDPAWTGGYTLLLAGTNTGNGYYGLNMAAAVPEPAEYAMLLAGLGVVGMVARRRKMHVN
ncbi:MAG: FxDxF family PEP-CTERM protein [Betaproteobacteria bacterium]|nr:FxDxF family PEP-CTERM protein [Betaproteobacteria bacterium]